MLVALLCLFVAPPGERAPRADYEEELNAPPRPVNVKVSPRSGGPRTRFRIAFRAKNDATGFPRYYGVNIGPVEGSRCQDRIDRFFTAERGETVALRAPRRSPASWCPGRYEGIVYLERETPEGGTVVETYVARFSFLVHPPRRAARGR